MKDPVQCAAEEFRADLEQLARLRGESLGSTAQLEIATRALLQHESRRSEARLGPLHPRTIGLNARLESGLAVVRVLETERQAYRVKVPDVTDEGALVHGRIVDGQGRGIGRLLVCLVDPNGRPIREVADATTDDAGYFAHAIDPQLLERLRETQQGGIFLGVFTPGGRSVYRTRKPLALDEGARLFSEIALDRRAIARREAPSPTEEDREEHQVTLVPRIVGLPEDEASGVLERARLQLGVRRTKPGPGPAGTILEQDPAAEAEVPAGSAVAVVVGVAEAEGDIEVPRVTGIKLGSARSKLSRYDLALGRVEKRPSEKADVVLEQDPQEGQRVPARTPVNVVVGTGQT